MAEGLFHKLKTLAFATAHEAADSGISEMSIPVLKEKARELEQQRDTLNGEVATAQGHNRTIAREKAGIMIELAQVQTDGTAMKNGTDPNKDAKLAQLGARKVQLTADLASKNAEIAASSAAATQLDSVFAQVQQRSQDINNRIRTLASQQTTGKAKDHAADVINQTAELLGTMPGSDIDSIADKIQSDNDVSDVKLERAMGSFSASAPQPDAAAVSDAVNSF